MKNLDPGSIETAKGRAEEGKTFLGRLGMRERVWVSSLKKAELSLYSCERKDFALSQEKGLNNRLTD